MARIGTSVADIQATIVKSTLCQPNMLLSLFRELRIIPRGWESERERGDE
jgi:hypothetical protein